MEVIDLFAGCGGLSLGFARAGFSVTRAVEIDPVIAGTYEKNHPGTRMLVAGIEEIDQTDTFSRGEADVIIGGPPCQGFSMAGARIREGFMGDERNYLFRHYFNVVRRVKPALFVMENVKGIMTMERGEIFREILRLFSDPEQLEGEAYHTYHRVVQAASFGIPQKRERVILLGVLDRGVDMDRLWRETEEEVKEEDPDFFSPVTVRDAIGNLPLPTADGEVPNPRPQTPYQRALASGGAVLCNHTQTRHSPLAVKRMHQVGRGENFTVLHETITSVHSGSYGRLRWDEPAATITTRFDTPAGGRFIHPDYDRTLTPREAARIQSFPDSFVFTGSRTSICRQIGNAVPPKIAYFLARLARRILEEQEAKA